MGTLELKWGPNGDPKTEKGPHGDLGPQMGTNVGAVLKVGGQGTILRVGRYAPTSLRTQQYKF